MITPIQIGKYLSQQCTPDEARRIEEWIGESNENRSVYARLKSIWDETGQVRPGNEAQETNAAWQKVRARIQVPETKTAPKRPLSYLLTRAAAAAVIIISMVTFYIVNTSTQSGTMQMVEISTQKGERRQLELADGSMVWLNAESTIKYPKSFDGNTREVYVDGEAYFKVQHNAEKPFMVHTDELVTKVLGTSFNVMAYPESDDIIVSLDEGKVALSCESEKLELAPGFKAIFGKKAHTLQKVKIESKHNEWRNNVIDFNNITLHQAAITLHRWFGDKITITDEKLKNCRITASFTNPTIDEVMDIISTILPLEIEKKGNEYFINGQNCD